MRKEFGAPFQMRPLGCGIFSWRIGTWGAGIEGPRLFWILVGGGGGGGVQTAACSLEKAQGRLWIR